MRQTILLLGLSALFYGSSCNNEKKKEAEVSYLVTSPLKMDTVITKQYVCQIRSVSHIELRAQERGYLEKIYVDEGQFVKEGQPLFQIMPNLYQAEMQKAQAEVNLVDIEYRNTKGLADSNIVAPNELAMARAKLDKAKAELALSKVHLQFTTLRAPFDGIIDRFHVRLGSLVDEGELLTTLSDNRQLWVYFNVPESEYLEYKTHTKKDSIMTVKLLMANDQVFNQTGQVRTIEADFDNETGNIAFRATFPNPDGLLRHGETGNILISTPLKDALLIPQKATFEVLEKKYVYVIDKEHKVRSREIEIAAELPYLFAIKKGLSPGDKILLEGLRLVKENEQITYKMEDPKKVMANLNLYAE